MEDLGILIDRRNEIKAKFNQINEKNIKEKINLIKLILEENNVEEQFLLEFLKLKKENKDDDFEKYLELYEIAINEKNFNKFGISTKISIYEKITGFFIELKGIKDEKDDDKKLIKIIKILAKENKKYHQTFPILYSINKELYFNSLLYMFIKAIKNNYENEKENIKSMLNVKYIKEEELKYLTKKQKIENSNEHYKMNNIKEIDSILNYIYLCKANDFQKYIFNLSKFIDIIFEDFQYKFKDNDIFTQEKFEIGQKNDINLFTDFMFFLTNFNFLDLGKMKLFSNNWKETFREAPLNIDNFHFEDVKIQNINDNLKFISQEGQIDVFEKNNYSSNLLKAIKCKLGIYGSDMDCFQKDANLKMDKLYNKIFIKTHWDKLSDYISDILCSQTIKTVFEKIYKIPIIISDKSEIKKILNNIRFFNYRTSFVAETKKKFLYIYNQS